MCQNSSSPDLPYICSDSSEEIEIFHLQMNFMLIFQIKRKFREQPIPHFLHNFNDYEMCWLQLINQLPLITAAIPVDCLLETNDIPHPAMMFNTKYSKRRALACGIKREFEIVDKWIRRYCTPLHRTDRMSDSSDLIKSAARVERLCNEILRRIRLHYRVNHFNFSISGASAWTLIQLAVKCVDVLIRAIIVCSLLIASDNAFLGLATPTQSKNDISHSQCASMAKSQSHLLSTDNVKGHNRSTSRTLSHSLFGSVWFRRLDE